MYKLDDVGGKEDGNNQHPAVSYTVKPMIALNTKFASTHSLTWIIFTTVAPLSLLTGGLLHCYTPTVFLELDFDCLLD